MLPRYLTLACALVLLAASGGHLRARQEPASTREQAPDLAARVADVSKEVESLRGWQFATSVPVVRVTPDEARKEWERAFDSSHTPGQLARRVAVMRVTGLVPRDADLRADALSDVGALLDGYYNFQDRRLALISRTGMMPDSIERLVLAHELTHALDDQRADVGRLTQRRNQTLDAEFVALALVEGSAHALMAHYSTMMVRTGRVSPLDVKAYLEQAVARLEAIRDRPRGLNELLASYICGASFLTRKDLFALQGMADDRPIGESLLAAVKDLPGSSEQIIHPDKYWDPAQRDEPVTIDDAGVEQWLSGMGMKVAHRDTLGEIFTAVLTEPRSFPKDLGKLMSSTAWTNRGAIGWGGDRLFLIAEPSARNAAPTKAVWVTAWDGPWENGRFRSALTNGYPPEGYLAVPFARRVTVVLFGFSPAERQRLTAALKTARFRFRQGGASWDANPPPAPRR